MASNTISASSRDFRAATTEQSERTTAGSFITLTGRILFSAIFVVSGFFHFSPQEIAYAANSGVPAPGFLVPASGILAMAGGLSILFGYRARIGAWLLVLFLVPVTLMLHNFWAVKDPMMAQVQMAMFMKNVSMIGGALLISQFGAGPLSLDGRRDSAK
jgi:putative oxidoreductase